MITPTGYNFKIETELILKINSIIYQGCARQS